MTESSFSSNSGSCTTINNCFSPSGDFNMDKQGSIPCWHHQDIKLKPFLQLRSSFLLKPRIEWKVFGWVQKSLAEFKSLWTQPKSLSSNPAELRQHYYKFIISSPWLTNFLIGSKKQWIVPQAGSVENLDCFSSFGSQFLPDLRKVKAANVLHF